MHQRARLLKSEESVDSLDPCNDPSCHDEEDTTSGARNVGGLSSWFQQRRRGRAGLAPPPSRTEIGRAGWLLLHTIAATSSEKPLKGEQDSMADWIWSFARLYPCHVCRTGFIQVLENNPPVTVSRDSLTMWTCNAHNAVNGELGQPQYPCNLSDLLALHQHTSP